MDPVEPDDPNHGSPSDHRVPVAHPLTQTSVVVPREFIVKTARPLPESGLQLFSQWIKSEEWDCLPTDATPTDQVAAFQTKLDEKLNEIFPLKVFKLFTQDKPFITCELKRLDRFKKRVYSKHGAKSEKYLKLRKLFDEKYLKAAHDYLQKNVSGLLESDPGKAYSTLKKMGAQPGDCQDDGSFQLIQHLDQNLSTEESTERIAQHFANISSFPHSMWKPCLSM